MDARAKTVKEILHSGDQYLVPFFQRSYSWRKKHWERLWQDILALTEDGLGYQHFLGPLVCTPSPHLVPGQVPAYQLIDGQQRLTTLTLLLLALRETCRAQKINDLAEEITEDFLIHKRKTDLQRYKVVPRIGDREALIALIEGNETEDFEETALFRAKQFFLTHLRAQIVGDGHERLRKLFNASTYMLSLVVITIEGENPYEIFESLNSTGLPLEESDLIRNFIFMQIPLDQQEEFHEKHWLPFEQVLEQDDEEDAKTATAFYRDYLMRNGTYCKSGRAFVRFKEENLTRKLPPNEQVKELTACARNWMLLNYPERCKDDDLKHALLDFKSLDASTAHPLLLNLLNRRNKGEIGDGALCKAIRDLSSFLLRRSVCGESTRQYNKWFPAAIREIGEEADSDLQQVWFQRGFPDDEAFTKALIEFPIYRRETAKAGMLLAAIERSFRHKEKVDPNALTIEHVMPQTIDNGPKGKSWKEALGDDWESDHRRYLHALGNLTLTGYNTELGNQPFAQKREKLLESHVDLNKYFAEIDVWERNRIIERGEALATKACELFPRPVGGPAYIPGAGGSGRISTKEGKRLREEYWTEFVGDLEGELPDLNPGQPSALGYLVIRGNLRQVRFIPFMNKGEIGVTYRIQGPTAKAIYEYVLRGRDEIEQEVGADLEVVEDESKYKFIVRWESVDPMDRSLWEEQHQWLIDEIRKLDKAIGDRIRKAFPEDDKLVTEYDREYWEERVGGDVMRVVDEVETILKELNASIRLKHNKYHLGIIEDAKVKNFAYLVPKQKFLKIEVLLEDREEWKKKIVEAGIRLVGDGVQKRWLRFRLYPENIRANRELLKTMFVQARTEYSATEE